MLSRPDPGRESEDAEFREQAHRPCSDMESGRAGLGGSESRPEEAELALITSEVLFFFEEFKAMMREALDERLHVGYGMGGQEDGGTGDHG